MADRENSNLGEEIQDIVQNAVSTMDFQKLNSEISTTVNAALSEVRQALGIVPVGKNELQGPKPGTWRPVGPQRTAGDSKRWPPLEETAPYASAAIPEQRGPSALPPGQRRTGMPQEGVPNRGGRPVEGGEAGGMAGGRRISSGSQGAHQNNNPQTRGAEGYLRNRQAAGGRGGQGGQGGQPGQPGRPGWGFAGRGQAGTQGEAAGRKSWKQTATDIINTQKSRLDAVNSRGSEERMVDRPGQGRSGVPIPYVPVGNISGMLLTIFGSLGSTLFGITSLVMFILLSAWGEDVFAAVLAGMLPAFIVSMIVARRGSKIRRRLRRMRSYMKVLQVRGFSSVKELANATGATEKFVRKDLRKMLSIGMFPEGRLDDTQTCFMATRKSSEQYRIAQSGYERREAEEKARQAEVKRKEARQAKALVHEEETEREESVPDTLMPEVKEAVENGREYMRQIRETNDAIPDEEVSEQLDRLELVIDRIFYHVEKHPEQLSEIRKFMEYYLPTTLKLLKAYQEFDSQPVQGENIKTAKKEIRNTLNTINIAFENLLDSLFEDAAMDVSTDISVLQTMLKQEGLTGSEFEQASHESKD